MKIFYYSYIFFVLGIHIGANAQESPEFSLGSHENTAISEHQPKNKLLKKKNWYLDLSISNFATRWGRADFDLNGYVDYRMRDIDYDDAAFKGVQFSIGIRKEIAKNLDIGIKGSFLSTQQFVSLTNNFREIEQNQEGFIQSFYILGSMTYHQRIEIGLPVQYRLFDRLILEAMPSVSYNVSHWREPQNYGRNAQVRERYKYVFDNTMNNSKHILFGYGAIGYEYRSAFVKLFYQRNLTRVSSFIPLRDQNFEIDFPRWVNWGFTIGVGLRLTEKPILGYDRRKYSNQ